MGRIISREAPTVFSVKGWCPKCMSNVYIYQPKPMTDPLLMQCETCGTEQNAISTELRTLCVGESVRLKEIRAATRKRKKK